MLYLLCGGCCKSGFVSTFDREVFWYFQWSVSDFRIAQWLQRLLGSADPGHSPPPGWRHFQFPFWTATFLTHLMVFNVSFNALSCIHEFNLLIVISHCDYCAQFSYLARKFWWAWSWLSFLLFYLRPNEFIFYHKSLQYANSINHGLNQSLLLKMNLIHF